MSVSSRVFGTTCRGETVTEYTLTNKSGANVRILDMGGIVTAINVPDRNGVLGDVALAFDTPDVYEGPKNGSMGMLIGRVGNRIAGAKYSINGVEYTMTPNEGANNLHSGPDGFGTRIWDAEVAEEDGAPALILHLFSPEGDQGFPGSADVTVTYLFTENNELVIQYVADVDEFTLMNMTNHTYFNLDGHDSGTVHDHVLQVFAPCTTEAGEGLIPTGKLLPVESVNWNFSAPRRMGDVLALTDSDPAMKAAGGVDFNFSAGYDKQVKTIAILKAPKSGRVMQVITDQPSVQCYTGQGLNVTGKGGAEYKAYSGMCLETQHDPDAIHHAYFPTIVVRPDEDYHTTTVYKFTVEE